MSFTWTSASLSHPGNARKVNEDACLERPEYGLWMVADGMGGHEAGDFASRHLASELAAVGAWERPGEFVARVEERIEAANAYLYEWSQRRTSGGTAGSTVVTLLALKDHCVALWAGDSRVYQYRQGRLMQATRDHSEVEELVAAGALAEEDAETHPAAHVITRAVGAAPTLEVDFDLFEIADGDRFLLCSDGLYKELSRADMERLMGGAGCAQICRALIDEALSRDCSDNVSVVVIEFRGAPRAAEG